MVKLLERLQTNKLYTFYFQQKATEYDYWISAEPPPFQKAAKNIIQGHIMVILDIQCRLPNNEL